MHIKLDNILKIGLTMLLLTFFGFIGYADMFKNKTSAAEHAVATTLVKSSNQSNVTTQKTSEYYGAMRAKIALAEYNLGVVEQPRGCNCGPIVDKYTEGQHAQWCTMFASWVAKQAGSPLINEKTKTWRLVNSRDFATNLQKNGTWYSREDVIAKGIKPKVGDFMVFWRGNFEDNLGHVDIVIDTEKSPGVAGLLGGNLKDKVQYRDFPYLQYYGFLGFGRPEKD